MAVKIKTVLDILEKTAPLSLQEEWDNSGLQVGDVQASLKGILLCVDVTENVLCQAIDQDANLIIAHHPLIFGGVNQIDVNTSLGKIMQTAIKHDICIYASHTAFDLCPMNMSKDILEKISCTPGSALNYLQIGKTDAPVLLKDIICILKKRFNKTILATSCADMDAYVHTIGAVSGSGGDLLSIAKESGCDLFITGELKYHDFQKALQLNLPALCVGHFESEKSFPVIVKMLLEERFFSEQNKIAVVIAQQNSFQKIF